MKDVIISIVGIPNGDEAIEFVTDGKYCYGKDKTVFSYMESELTGLAGTKTTFTVEEAFTTLVREGKFNSQMVFEEGRKHFFLYDTPFGSTTMGVDTKRIIRKLDEHGGCMKIEYFLDLDNVNLGRNEFRINIKEAYGK